MISKMRYITILCAVCALFLGRTGDAGEPSDTCFCELHGQLDDCECSFENIDSFNNKELFPRLKELIYKDYFRYWKVNMNKKCGLSWGEDGQCASKSCHIEPCDKTLPEGLKDGHHKNKYSAESQHADCDDKHPEDEDEDELGVVDSTISDESKEAFETWRTHDDSQHNFCELDDDNSEDCSHYDLLLNPERFTGYVGDSAIRIWKTIYQENCFTPDPVQQNYASGDAGEGDSKLKGSPLEAMCLEKRVFYRLMSGFHTSININLSAEHFYKGDGWGPGRWDYNLDGFKWRFDPERTKGEGPGRLRNIYFAWLLELRAIVKAAPYLEKELFYTGNPKADKEVQDAVKEVLEIAKAFPEKFDESLMFAVGDPQENAKLKDEFKLKFRNISKIMDCVGCSKCKLWGKVQITGMGTALKILFSGDSVGPQSSLSHENIHMEGPHHFQLRRQEIIALFHSIARKSKAINELQVFRHMLKTEKS